MTIQDFIKQGHKWIELKSVPVRDIHSKSIVFIHNHFFEGKELEFQNKLIAYWMKLCPTEEWSWRVYGGDTPDADMVDWIYTQTAEIVSGDESVMPAWCKNGQHVLFEGRLHVIECAPKKEYEHLHEVIIEDCETHHCHFENWDNMTPCTPDGRELLPEPPAEVTISTDGESHEPTLYERHNITAGEREVKAKGSASYIRRQARMAREAFYYHKGARIETRIAYRNGTDDPDGMSYKVCWYDETRTGELHLVECENGISLEQAARHMADFSLLSECGLTLRQILYPTA